MRFSGDAIEEGEGLSFVYFTDFAAFVNFTKLVVGDGRLGGRLFSVPGCRWRDRGKANW